METVMTRRRGMNLPILPFFLIVSLLLVVGFLVQASTKVLQFDPTSGQIEHIEKTAKLVFSYVATTTGCQGQIAEYDNQRDDPSKWYLGSTLSAWTEKGPCDPQKVARLFRIVVGLISDPAILAKWGTGLSVLQKLAETAFK